MALSADVWKNSLKPLLLNGLNTIQSQMHSGDETKDDAWFAEQLAELLSSAIASSGTDQIKTAGVPAGSVIIAVAGQATGTPNVMPINVQ